MPSMKYMIPINSMKFWCFDSKGKGSYTMVAKFKKGALELPNDPDKAYPIICEKYRQWTKHDGPVVLEYKDLYGGPPFSFLLGANPA